METFPLITCIMPTRGRPKLAPMAVDCWLSQSYPNKELLILDDGDDPSFPENWIAPAGVTRTVTAGTIRYSIPEKLNMLCEMANGDIICRFDSDDWSAPGRITDQVQRLLDSGLSVCGYHSMIFVDESGNCRKYVNDRSYALGTSLMFKKDFWKEHPFNVKHRVGSDNFFVTDAREARQLSSADPVELMFARAHDSNTSEKKMNAYQRVSAEECEFVMTATAATLKENNR